MHHQDVFGRNGAVGLQLEQPVPIAVLCFQQRVTGMIDAAIQRRMRGESVEFQWTRLGGSRGSSHYSTGYHVRETVGSKASSPFF